MAPTNRNRIAYTPWYVPTPTNLWKRLSWAFGDRHADRICGLIWLYVKVFGLKSKCPGWEREDTRKSV